MVNNNSNDHEKSKLKNYFKNRQKTLRGRDGKKRKSTYPTKCIHSKTIYVYNMPGMFESLDIKTHYKARVIRAAWYHQKNEITEKQFRRRPKKIKD